MSTSNKASPPVSPALIVLGTPAGMKEPQAAWFRAEYAERAKSAAQRQGLTTILINSNETRAAAATLKEGELKAGGQLVLPSVSQETISRLRAFVVTASVKPSGSPGTAPVGVQVPVSVWDKLKLADIVLAAFLDNAGEPDGWYEATIMKIENGIYTLQWLYEPEAGFVRLQRKHIAVMFPG
jgi:hypothetical protein